MKNAIKALAACVAVMLSCAAWAENAVGPGGRIWTYNIVGGNARLTAVSTKSGDVIVPKKVNGYDVTEIGGVFYGCKTITSLAFEAPSKVTKIEDSMCYGCTSLTEVSIPASVTTIEDDAFYGCNKLVTLTFEEPSSLTSIGWSVFEDCISLTEVTIPDGVTAIGVHAFAYCTSLERVSMSVTTLGAVNLDYAFHDGSSDLAIASAEAVDGLTWQFRIVDGGAELYYDDDADVPTIPDTTSGAVVIPDRLGGYPVVSIGEEAFDVCDIGSVSIPATVTRIGDGAFSECEYLKSVIFRGTPTLASIGEDAFYDCTDLESLTIPASVTTIGDWAFEDCMRIALTVPDTVATIGDGAFQGCDAMADANGFVIVRGVLHHYTDKDDGVTIPEGVTRIGSAAFWSCDIESVAIPASVTSIGSSAFGRCKYLEGIEIPATVTSIGPKAFWGCEAMADKDGFVIVRDVLYYYAEDAATVTIPSGVTEIGEGAFYDNDDIESVVIPASVAKIGDTAFYLCDNLAVATIPSSVATIGSLAFADIFLDLLPAKVHVGAGDTARVKTLLTNSRHKSVDAATFVEDVPAPCSVLFDANGGSVSSATRLVTTGAALGALPEAVRSGWTLLGWFTAAEGGEEVTAATVVTGDATYYAHWAEVVAYTWFTKRADAFAEARRTGKKVFMICGRDECGNTMYTKNVSCEDPTVKAKLIAKCVLWYTNCDTQLDENRYYWPTGTFTLPLVCIIDPANEKGFLKRATGPLEPAGILALLADIPYPDSSSPVLDPSSSPVLDPEVIDPLNPGDLPWYTVLNARDISAPYIAQKKAETLRGAAYYGAEVMGVVELKIGKVSNKGTSKISGSVTTLAGKKHTIKAQSVYMDDKMAISVYLEVKGLGALAFALGSKDGKNVFAGALGKWHVQTANVGGNWTKGGATAEVAVEDVSAFAGTVLVDLLPTNVTAKVSRGKWAFDKAASVKLKNGALTGIDDPKKPNLSGMKLSYTPKTGMFKGSFKVYALNGTKLVKYTMNVTGVVIDGVGYGKATCKRPAVSWSMKVQ